MLQPLSSLYLVLFIILADPKGSKHNKSFQDGQITVGFLLLKTALWLNEKV